LDGGVEITAPLREDVAGRRRPGGCDLVSKKLAM
jgi:hypothetical protein